jgi:photosystem II stability/assembly factor-like uncharacterized protein
MVLYAAVAYNGVYKTTNGGESWIESNNGLPVNSYVQALALNISDPQVIYLGTYTNGVYKSTDGGNLWLASNQGLTDKDVLSLDVDPSDPSKVYAGTRGGVFKSTDSGDNWVASNSGLGSLVIKTMDINPLHTNIVYAGTAMGVFESIDSGVSWAPRINGLPSPKVYWVGVDPIEDDVVYIGTGDQGVFYSNDAGETWIPRNNGLRHTTIYSLAIDKQNTNNIYAASAFGGVYGTKDGGLNWEAINNGLKASQNIIPSIVIHPRYTNYIYAGDRGIINISKDRGKNWNPTSNGLPFTYNNTLLVDPDDPGHIYTGTNIHGVYITENFGAEWFRSNNGMSSVNIKELDLDPQDPQTIYASTGFDGGVNKSTDEGLNWIQINNGLPIGDARSLAIDPNDHTHLLVAIEGEGVYESINSGDSWMDLDRPGLTSLDFWSIVIDRSEPPRIHLGTREGVFNLTLVPSDLEDEFPPEPIFPIEMELFQNYPNPFNPSTTIQYHIPEGNGILPVKVFVYDIRGRLVRKLVDQEKSPGAYQVHWDGRDEQGQQVSSGVYLYRMQIDLDIVSTKKMVLLK